MTAHSGTAMSALVVLLSLGLAPPALLGQTTQSGAVVAEPTPDGGSTVLLETETTTTEIRPGTTTSTRHEYSTDIDGQSTLAQTVEERRVRRSDGSQSVVREFTQPGVSGATQATRRETEETYTQGDGVFRTDIEVSIPGANSNRFVTTERIEETEWRDGDRVVESERTTYTNLTNRGEWEASEQRVTTHAYTEAGTESVETVYRADGTGSMTLSDEIVRREWTGSRGQEHSREEIFAVDIPGQARTAEPQLYQQVDTVRTTRPDGRVQTTREVRERRGSRTVVVEKTIERERPDGRGGTVIEQETQQLDVNGKFRTVGTSRTRESER